MSPDNLPPPPPPPSGDKRGRSGGKPESGWPRWSLWVLLGLVTASVVVSSLLSSQEDSEAISYDKFMTLVEAGQVESVEINNDNAKISGVRANESGAKFTTTGPLEGGIPEADLAEMREQGVEIEFNTPQPGLLVSILPFLLPVLLLIGFFWWMQRRAQGQMSGIMSIGRSKAKTYSTERPGTTFADVAGYDGRSPARRAGPSCR
jgi:cell division protease FtsH